MGNVAFRKIQLGEEGTEGSPVAATAILLAGEGATAGLSLENRISLIRRAPVSSLAAFGRQYLAQRAVGLRYDGDLTVEQVLYLLHMGVKGNVSPAGTSPYVWTFDKALTAAPTLDSFTVEFGDDTQAYEANGVLAEALEFSGAQGEPWRMGGDLFGWKRVATTFTPGLGAPDVTPIPFSYTKLYIDATWAALGGNQLDAELLGASLSIPGVYPKWRGGTLEPSAHGIEPSNATLELRLEFTSNIVTELANVEAGTERFIRLIAQTDANHIFQIDGCFTWDPATIFDADRGDNVVPLTGLSMEDPTSSNELEIVVTNQVSTLP